MPSPTSTISSYNSWNERNYEKEPTAICILENFRATIPSRHHQIFDPRTGWTAVRVNRLLTLLVDLALPRCREVRCSYFFDKVIMLAKKTSKNQVTLPPKALQDIPETDDFDITAQGVVLILRPATVDDPGSRLAVVRQNIKDLGIVPKD